MKFNVFEKFIFREFDCAKAILNHSAFGLMRTKLKVETCEGMPFAMVQFSTPQHPLTERFLFIPVSPPNSHKSS